MRIGSRGVNLAKEMSKVLQEDMVVLMKRIGRLSDSLGFAAFAVGGLVRDLMLGVKNLDLDIMVEGDAIKLGHILAGQLNAAIVVHKKFGTCSVIMEDKLKIDIATARRETYEKPAVLPAVEFSPFKDDLMRRDFTINAMAISINRSSFGQLIDFFNGKRDLELGRIKALHAGSFIDDPTRIFRAVRFESRLGFVIDHATEELAKNAIDQSIFDKVAPQRIRDELILILKEKEPLSVLKRMAELDELRFVHPALKMGSGLIRLCGAIDKTCAEYEIASYRKRAVDRWLMYLMGLFEDLTQSQVSAICNRFAFKGSDSLRLLSYKERAAAISASLGAECNLAPSTIYKLLEPLSLEVVLMILAGTVLIKPDRKAGYVKSRIKAFLAKYNGTRLNIGGDDLKAMGLKSGPVFKSILDKMLYDKIDGKLRTRKDELECARYLAGRVTVKKRR